MRGVFYERNPMKQYFKPSEFECKCGCGQNNMSLELAADLNTARHLAGVPFVINSGSRCAAHNKNVGGLPSSSHVKGLAADIRAGNSQERLKILQALIQMGFNRIGIHKTFIHVDVDPDKPAGVLWLYI